MDKDAKKPKIIKKADRTKDAESVTDIFKGDIIDGAPVWTAKEKPAKTIPDLVKDIEDNIKYIEGLCTNTYTLQLRPALNQIKESLEVLKKDILVISIKKSYDKSKDVE